MNDAGTVVNTYGYTPWGEIRSETETVDNPIKYAGEYYDDEHDMIYLRARYYNPQIGRFTSLDIEEGEISNPLDMNRYVYCRNNPTKYIDPTGEAAIAISVGSALLAKAAPYIVAGIAAVGTIMFAEHHKKAQQTHQIYLNTKKVKKESKWTSLVGRKNMPKELQERIKRNKVII